MTTATERIDRLYRATTPPQLVQVPPLRFLCLEFWAAWMRAEEPFLAADPPWSRATLIVNGTPAGATRDRTLVALGPLRHFHAESSGLEA
jgi:hypothetical protein